MAKFTQMDAAREIQEQLSSEKRKLGFFFGAGTSMTVKLPGIDELTSKVYLNLSLQFSNLSAAVCFQRSR